MWLSGAILLAVVVAGTIAMVLGMIVLSYRPLAYGVVRFLEILKIPRKLTSKLRELYDNLTDLVKPVPLLSATAMSMAAWLCECLGFALIVRSFPGAQVPLAMAMLIVAGEIDLSIAATMALASLAMGLAMQAGASLPLMLGAAVATGSMAARGMTG